MYERIQEPGEKEERADPLKIQSKFKSSFFRKEGLQFLFFNDTSFLYFPPFDTFSQNTFYTFLLLILFLHLDNFDTLGFLIALE